MRSASLVGAILSNSNLTGADLSVAMICEAYFAGVNLSEANLTGALFQNVDLTEVDFLNADLTNAALDGNLIVACRNLHKARCLEDPPKSRRRDRCQIVNGLRGLVTPCRHTTRQLSPQIRRI